MDNNNNILTLELENTLKHINNNTIRIGKCIYRDDSDRWIWMDEKRDDVANHK